MSVPIKTPIIKVANAFLLCAAKRKATSGKKAIVKVYITILYKKEWKMTRDALIEKIKTIPEDKLDEVAKFVDNIDFKVNLDEVPVEKLPFFEAIGKISFDKDEVESFRNMVRI